MNEIRDNLKKVAYVGIGAIAETLKKATTISDDLAKAGEKVVAKGKVYNEELQHNVKTKIDAITDVKKDSDISDLANKINELNSDEASKLHEKLAALKESEKEYNIQVNQENESNSQEKENG